MRKAIIQIDIGIVEADSKADSNDPNERAYWRSRILLLQREKLTLRKNIFAKETGQIKKETGQIKKETARSHFTTRTKRNGTRTKGKGAARSHFTTRTKRNGTRTKGSGQG
jgi:hypothetical protein